MKIESVTIIGAGPAGLATAIQLVRYGFSVVLLEKEGVGGLLRNANLVENYPGFPDGITGVKLVELFVKQAARVGVQVTCEEVQELDWVDHHFLIRTEKREFLSRVVVVATGTKPKQLCGFEFPIELSDRIFYEVYPLLDVEDCDIAIVGAGDAAFDYGLNLARQNDVLILNRGVDRKCLPLLWERASIDNRIRYYHNTSICGMSPSNMGKILIKCSTPDGRISFLVDYLIGAIGRDPELGFLSARLKNNLSQLEDQGEIHLIGDVKNNIYRQTSIAVGDGVLAAMKIYRKFHDRKEMFGL